MQIVKGKIFINKTWKYLYPLLSDYGKELTERLNKVFKLAVGIHDFYLKNTRIDNSLFILIDIEPKLNKPKDNIIYRSNFIDLIEYVRLQDYYVTDYMVEDNENNKTHMVVIKLPKKFNISVMFFLLGKYSKMFTLDQINKFFKNNITKKILKRDSIYFPTFIKKLEEKFNINVDENLLRNSEYDLPPEYKEEIFNYEEG